MCGRYTLTADEQALQTALGVEGLIHPRRRFNLAPTQKAPAVIQAGGGPTAAVLQWGLIPFWARRKGGTPRPLINARAESVHEKPSFRDAFRRRRCLIPADGFYEWRAGPGGKEPFWIHRPDRSIFTFAGLWEEGSLDSVGAPHATEGTPGDAGDRAGEEAEGPSPTGTFTILTMGASPALRHLHDRMPVVIPPDGRDAWLDVGPPWTETRDWLSDLMERSRRQDDWRWRPVSRRVNSPANDDPTCLEVAGAEEA